MRQNICFQILSNFQNDSAKDWIQRLVWKTTDKLFLERVPILLYELEKKPIGMGRGQFLVDESFLYRVSCYLYLYYISLQGGLQCLYVLQFLGMVGSVFVLEAESKESNTD